MTLLPRLMQAGAQPVSQPPTPAAAPLSVAVVRYRTNELKASKIAKRTPGSVFRQTASCSGARASFGFSSSDTLRKQVDGEEGGSIKKNAQNMAAQQFTKSKRTADDTVNQVKPAADEQDPFENGKDRSQTSEREGQAPLDMKGPGWIVVLKRTASQFSDDRLLSVAAGVTFYTLLALFPGIAALVSIFGLFADPAAISTRLSDLSALLPGGAIDVIGDQIARVTEQEKKSLGFGFLFGMSAALWSASSGMKAMLEALNIVYDEHERRGFIRLRAVAFLFAFGAIVFLMISLGAVVILPIVFNAVGLGGISSLLMDIVRWPALFVITAAALAIVYRFGPSRECPKWQWISWGSISAAFLWVAGSVAFSWYVQNFGTFNRTYGSLGAVIGFMTWIWLSTAIVLLGAELNSEIERRTERQQYRGRPAGTGE